ncbi:MAG: hypothetical protein BYD32DRAFT_464637 [Podila humilis]|nr:MAG: hypothetical protein BYD32DRAFT_464637 [Podila humilis]
MRTFITLAVATSFLTTSFARFLSCGSDTNHFIFKGAEYASPANPTLPVCLTIAGKVRTPFPANAVATLRFDDTEDDTFSQIFGLQLRPPRSEAEIINTGDLQFCFYFPPKFSVLKNTSVQVHVNVEHSEPGNTKRVMCFQGPISI